MESKYLTSHLESYVLLHKTVLCSHSAARILSLSLLLRCCYGAASNDPKIKRLFDLTEGEVGDSPDIGSGAGKPASKDPVGREGQTLHTLLVLGE